VAVLQRRFVCVGGERRILVHEAAQGARNVVLLLHVTPARQKYLMHIQESMIRPQALAFAVALVLAGVVLSKPIDKMLEPYVEPGTNPINTGVGLYAAASFLPRIVVDLFMEEANKLPKGGARPRCEVVTKAAARIEPEITSRFKHFSGPGRKAMVATANATARVLVEHILQQHCMGSADTAVIKDNEALKKDLKTLAESLRRPDTKWKAYLP
jgi:hypothetical protein